MAEEHGHGGGGEGGEISMKEAGERITVILIFLFFLSLLLLNVSGEGGLYTFWLTFKDWFFTMLYETSIGKFLLRAWFAIQFIGTYLSLVFLIGIVILLKKVMDHKREDEHHYGHHIELAHEEEKPEKTKWERIQEHLKSDSASDWRLAILEADIMLEEMMEKSGSLGETLGEKLKNIEKSDFATLDKAWEAHKIRNLIAHEGSNFLISQREARRVIQLYKDVFDEFNYL